MICESRGGADVEGRPRCERWITVSRTGWHICHGHWIPCCIVPHEAPCETSVLSSFSSVSSRPPTGQCEERAVPGCTGEPSAGAANEETRRIEAVIDNLNASHVIPIFLANADIWACRGLCPVWHVAGASVQETIDSSSLAEMVQKAKIPWRTA